MHIAAYQNKENRFVDIHSETQIKFIFKVRLNSPVEGDINISRTVEAASNSIPKTLKKRLVSKAG